MANEIQTAIEAINDLLETNVPNIKKAYDYPPEALFDERCVMTYYGGGDRQTQDASFNKGLHNIICDFIVFRKDVPRDMELLMTDIDLIYSTLAENPTLSDTVSTFERVSCEQPIASEWAGMPISILRFMLENVKIQTS